jgi:hypothetical protein
MRHRKLSIHFHGICTHFRGIVPGVPHRVVLADTMSILGGAITVGTNPAAPYMFSPHIPLLLPGKGGSLKGEAPGYLDGGLITNGIRLQILNARDKELTYPDQAFENDIPSLSTFMPTYRPSTEVVYAGRASAYFDVFAGEVRTRSKGQAYHTAIDVHTDGDPILLVTPLAGDPHASPAPSFQLTVTGTEVLKVANYCLDTNEFDFLLNYVTAEGGIPRVVNAGFPLEQPGVAAPADREAMLRPGGLNAALLAELEAALYFEEFIGTSLACSDSRYP